MRRARITGLAAANLAALGALVLVLSGPGGGERQEDGGRALHAEAQTPGAIEIARVAESSPPAPVTAAEGAARAAPRRAIDRELQRQLERIAGEAIERARTQSGGRVGAENACVAVHVRELGCAGELSALRADRSLRPASNMKLVTTAAALVLLGPEWSFRTRFEAAGELAGGALRGDLVLRAGGDPLYDPDAEGEVAELLAPIVRELRAAGLARIEGDLVLDEGSYAAPAPGPSWPSDDQHWQDYCALAGGFSANAGCLTAVVEAGRPGAPARVRVLPRAHGLERRGEVATGVPRSELRIAVEARPPFVTVRGTLPADVPRWRARFAHPDPVALFGQTLRAALAEGGIELAGGIARERGRPAGLLLAELSSPLLALLVPINAESNNAVADHVFLALGAEVGGGGDREGGARAVRLALERLGVPSAGLVQVDGSGLSREDRVTARQVTALLDAVLAAEGPRAAAFRDSLAVAGQSGTLATRMRSGAARGRVRAKTGWIAGTSALSGLVETEGGRRLAFSILIEYPRVSGLNHSVWKPMQDAICEALVAWDGGS